MFRKYWRSSRKRARKSSALRMLRMVAEKKYAIATISSSTIATTGYISPLIPSIAQGDTAITRTGDKITVTSLMLNLSLKLQESTTTAEPLLCRVIVFQWLMDAAAAAPGVTSILLAADTLAHYTQSPATTATYRIMLDKTYYLGPKMVWIDQTAGTNSSEHFIGGGSVHRYRFFSFPRRTLAYSAGSATVLYGNTYIIVLPDQDNRVEFDCRIKLAFIDV